MRTSYSICLEMHEVLKAGIGSAMKKIERLRISSRCDALLSSSFPWASEGQGHCVFNSSHHCKPTIVCCLARTSSSICRSLSYIIRSFLIFLFQTHTRIFRNSWMSLYSIHHPHLCITLQLRRYRSRSGLRALTYLYRPLKL